MEYLTVGKKIQLLRTEKGMTQADLAKRLGVTIQAIANYERGRRGVKPKTISVISAIFNIPTYYFLDECQDKPWNFRKWAKKQDALRGLDMILDTCYDKVRVESVAVRDVEGHQYYDFEKDGSHTIVPVATVSDLLEPVKAVLSVLISNAGYKGSEKEYRNKIFTDICDRHGLDPQEELLKEEAWRKEVIAGFMDYEDEEENEDSSSTTYSEPSGNKPLRSATSDGEDETE